MRIETTYRCFSCLSLAIFAVAGCDSHTGSDYRGEVLATLNGEIRLERDSPPPSDEIEVFYQNYTDYLSTLEEGEALMQFVIVERVPVTGDYPAAFTLELFEPPPDEALTDFTVNGDPDERRVGLAIIASSYECWENFPFEGGRCIFGGASRMALVWAEDDILPDTRTATYVGTTLDAGYHLLEYRLNFTTSEAHGECLWSHREEEGGGNKSCPMWTFEREVPLDTSLSVRLIEGHDAAFGNLGGAVIPYGGLEMVNWFDPTNQGL